MIQQNVDYQEDLAALVQELNGISTDMSKYVDFIVTRQYLIDQVLQEGPALNN